MKNREILDSINKHYAAGPVALPQTTLNPAELIMATFQYNFTSRSIARQIAEQEHLFEQCEVQERSVLDAAFDLHIALNEIDNISKLEQLVAGSKVQAECIGEPLTIKNDIGENMPFVIGEISLDQYLGHSFRTENSLSSFNLYGKYRQNFRSQIMRYKVTPLDSDGNPNIVLTSIV